MSKINVLDKHVAELIAAGEVVERPSSVIKELVENSIDAGSSVITVEIRRGGITFMRVTDNGSGIDREDVTVAFLRHATSKVITQNDLDCIGTLGFRGEALASISAVSHTELLTRTADSEVGMRAVCDGGEIVETGEAGCPVGTTIIVRDLFFNTPARMKFLKKDIAEGNSVAKIIDKIALSHPEISFRLIRDGNEVLHTPGDNKMKSAIYSVFGKDFSSGLIPVGYELGGIKVYGFITLPHSARPNRNMENFFINGRCVRSKTAIAAIEEAYKGSILVGKFPGCVLHMDMDFSTVDVNVHPAKLEVRFANEKPIFDAVYHAVKSALTAGDTPKEFEIKKLPISPYASNDRAEQTVIKTPQAPVPARPAAYPQAEPNRISTTQAYIDKVKSDIFSDSAEGKSSFAQHIGTEIELIVDGEVKADILPQPQTEPVAMNHSKEIDAAVKPELKIEIAAKFIGEAFGTYIILQYGNDELMLIDKHAAHERLLYERLKAQEVGQEAQSLLVPIPVTLDKDEYTCVLTNLDKFLAAGFEIDDFGGGSVIVRSAPLSLDGEDAAAAVIEIAGYLLENRSSMSTDYMDWVYHNIACRAAIKGGDRTSNAELIELAKTLEANPDIKYCPHGRPVTLVLKKREIEKQFGRVQ